MALLGHNGAGKTATISMLTGMIQPSGGEAIIYGKKIKFIAHPCSKKHFWNDYDIEKLVNVANEYNIPMEFNWKDFYNWNTILERIDYVLKYANEIYVNSDAHNLNDLQIYRKSVIKYLKENKYI